MDIIWGLYLLSMISGLGFDTSHSITDMNEKFLSADECVKVAQELNSLQFSQKQIGLERGTMLRYVCIASVDRGTSL